MSEVHDPTQYAALTYKHMHHVGKAWVETETKYSGNKTLLLPVLQKLVKELEEELKDERAG